MSGPTPRNCPFCGLYGVTIVEASTFRWRAAQCKNCGAQGPDVRIQTLGDLACGGTREEWEEAARIDAIHAWNGEQQ